MRRTAATPDETSSKQKILRATADVLSRNGETKLSLSDVALAAGVSRPTLYRWFSSKEELLLAFGSYEQRKFDTGLEQATSDLRGIEKLDAALRFIVEFQRSYSGVRIADIEPEIAIARLAEVIPVMRNGLEGLIPGPNAAVKSATAVRVVVSHYLVRSDDGDGFLAQLRHAVGIRA